LRGLARRRSRSERPEGGRRQAAGAGEVFLPREEYSAAVKDASVVEVLQAAEGDGRAHQVLEHGLELAPLTGSDAAVGVDVES
jgi:hypothetical protein